MTIKEAPDGDWIVVGSSGAILAGRFESESEAERWIRQSHLYPKERPQMQQVSQAMTCPKSLELNAHDEPTRQPLGKPRSPVATPLAFVLHELQRLGWPCCSRRSWPPLRAVPGLASRPVPPMRGARQPRAGQSAALQDLRLGQRRHAGRVVVPLRECLPAPKLSQRKPINTPPITVLICGVFLHVDSNRFLRPLAKSLNWNAFSSRSAALAFDSGR